MAMIARGWGYRDLAKATGFDARFIANILSNHGNSWPAKKAINAALGQTIFSKPARVHRKPSTPQKSC